MSWSRPAVAMVWEAIDAYVRVAYGGKPAPSAVQQRLDTLRALPPDDLFAGPVLEADDKAAPTRYALRLGNPFYPHMKLVIERSPDGRGFLFRADTHDRHIRPAPGSRDYKAFCQLMEMNQRLSEQIDAEWAKRGVPTFKEYLRHDLARRTAAASAAGGQAKPGGAQPDE